MAIVIPLVYPLGVVKDSLTIKPVFPGVNSRFSEEAIKPAGQKIPSTPPPTDLFYHTLLKQILDSWFEEVRYRLFTVDEIHYKKILRAERSHPLLANLFKESQEFRILNLSMEGQPYCMGVCARKIRQRLALPDTLTIDQVETLSGSFNKPALAKNFGNPAVARILLVTV
jgi:hypothetical protein